MSQSNLDPRVRIEKHPELGWIVFYEYSYPTNHYAYCCPSWEYAIKVAEELVAVKKSILKNFFGTPIPNTV